VNKDIGPVTKTLEVIVSEGPFDIVGNGLSVVSATAITSLEPKGMGQVHELRYGNAVLWSDQIAYR
jgi:hypothetical protein